ncbi:MAG TPA: alpha/beta hydrolase [Pirellulales bacterium]|jgi:acetyl esterase/lipase
MKIRLAILITLFSIGLRHARAQEVTPLYSGAAPGSETWTHEEQEYFSPIFNTQVVTNVVKPTLTKYAPAAENANGTAVVICPGGGFHVLSINSEGVDVAKWLAERGVTAFVLKYRLVPTGKDGVVEMIGKKRDKVEEDMRSHFPLAAADGVAAVKYVRDHAAEFGINPKRIGLMGFSAGGSVTSWVALNYSADSRPDFVAPIYAYVGVIGEGTVPSDAPPLFALAASNDPLGLADDSVELYSKWLAAKKPAELHMYAKGGHGFGMKTQKLPSDHWIEIFGQWLDGQGLLKK